MQSNQDDIDGFTYKFNLTPELSFMYNKFNFKEPLAVLRTSDNNRFLIQIDFHLKGSHEILYLPKVKSNIGELESDSFNVLLSNSYLDCEFKYLEDQDHQNFSIVIDQSYIQRNFIELMNLKDDVIYLLTSRDKLYLGSKVQLNIFEIIHSILIDVSDGNRNYPLLKSKIDQVLALYFDFLNDFDFRNLKFNDLSNDLLNNAIQIINEKYNDVITVEGLAKQLSVSPAKLKRTFSDNLDTSVGKYIRKVKLKKAYHWIETNKYNVSEAGRMIGYSNLSHFTTAFRKEFGILPKQIKNQ
ncbi:helix-turn-helix transcriptional regulator [Marinigracilibium pacificum]|uniref:Helix-turn-helix transcriptional regulator n=1 Tax=Marinigracilibium pacificum TaxID=2729599 RepID=A0A848IZK4_9BACT|nr:helix-turn-helix transcriptional regulator [Marinigracilibium pacificum]NMM49973.1 helix-turn-helix transcriptional regulator [Marinigracilibium pacificum]